MFCKPSYLALVDPWAEQNSDVYFGDDNNVVQGEQETRYRSIVKSFASRKPGHQCDVIRKYSKDAAADFTDKSLDWVYIDGNHSHEACLEDLRCWAQRWLTMACSAATTSPSTLPLGLRVRRHPGRARIRRETGYKLVAVTVEHFPTFVVAKNPAGATVQKLRQLVFAHEPHVIQVADWEQAAVSHARLMTATPRSAFFSLTFPRAIS